MGLYKSQICTSSIENFYSFPYSSLNTHGTADVTLQLANIDCVELQEQVVLLACG
jgi:hypothetical protein